MSPSPFSVGVMDQILLIIIMRQCTEPCRIGILKYFQFLERIVICFDNKMPPCHILPVWDALTHDMRILARWHFYMEPVPCKCQLCSCMYTDAPLLSEIHFVGYCATLRLLVVIRSTFQVKGAVLSDPTSKGNSILKERRWSGRLCFNVKFPYR